MSVTSGAECLSVDDIWVESDTEVSARTVVRGPWPRVVPLAVVHTAVGELVGRVRGPEWRVSVRDVAVLRLFGQLADGDALDTHITCEAAGDDQIVASGRCARGGRPVAAITARLSVWRVQR
jgi:hypothetical protein